MTFSSRFHAFVASSAMAFAVVAMLAEPAFAQAASIETILQNIVDIMTGNILRLFATIAVILIAIAWMFGYMDLRRAGYWVLGIGVIAGSSELVNTITLASPATDALGRTGVDGYVDTHWRERFGSALLLSIVGDATSYANSQLQESDVDAQNTTSAGQQAAAIAVEQSINIPPTLNKHQGELVSIFVARDLDFSGIYRLRVTEPRNRILDRAVLGDFAPDSKLVTK